jgi:hypothetical protein
MRDDREQADYEAERFGYPFSDQWGQYPEVREAIEAFALAVGDLCRVRLVDVHHIGPGRIAA